jgi:hypothetical protein
MVQFVRSRRGKIEKRMPLLLGEIKKILLPAGGGKLGKEERKFSNVLIRCRQF